MKRTHYALFPKKQFKKDLKRLQKSRTDLAPLHKAIAVLVSGESLPAGYKDHPLKGELYGARECHIGPDWLLVYQKDEDRLILFLLRTGDHRRVLGIE